MASVTPSWASCCCAPGAASQSPTLAACLTLEATTCAWGLYLEFLQRLTGYRTFDWWDAFTNGVGALVGITLWLLVARRLARKTHPDVPAQAPSFKESEN